MKRAVCLSLAILMSYVMARGISVPAAEPAEPETITIRGKEYRVIPDEVFRKMGFEFPEVPPEENAAYDYIRAINAYKPLPGKGRSDPRYDVMDEGWPEDDAKLRNYLASNQKALMHLRAGASKQACHFPYLASPQVAPILDEPLFTMSHLMLFARERELVRFLRFVGFMREHDGDFAAAMDAYLTAVALGGHVSQDRSLLDMLFGIAIWEIGMKGMRVCALQHKVPEEVLLGAQKRLARLRALRPSCLDVIRFEQVYSKEALEYAFRGEPFLDSWLDVESWPHVLECFLLKSRGTQEKARLGNKKFWDALERLAQLPLPEYVQRMRQFFESKHEKLRPVVVEPPFFVMLWALTEREPILRYRILHERTRLICTVTDVFLALARYRAKHGEYPEKLDEAKGLMLSDGIDPFSGGLLHYRREDDGSFTLWSVGEDLTDDGGKIEEEKPRWLSADYVWNSGVIQGTD